ncbi:EcsC family protein [Flavihumibacter solisilvae]|uniref:EcsC n=1 Tax=Flavihumibacter solisilvae TaxID=1349421 RepID=A0A0C1LCU1_9BACT|nr:EcsC family protein [Flavihumibacter solisilvae]KIC93328.1 ecsC [Flavihumibacter solisilvae]
MHTDLYVKRAELELRHWQRQMQRQPSLLNNLSKQLQRRVNRLIPEKVHQAITTTIKQMIRGVLFGAKYTTAAPSTEQSLVAREMAVLNRIDIYRKTAAVEGGVTGAGGLLLGLADFPILLGIKLKLLYDIASLYGFDVSDYRERVYLLHIFELAFSSHEHRRNVYLKMTDWKMKSLTLPEDINQFDWRSFQQEYRDYLDIAKIAQLMPVIGAPVGVIVNYRLVKKLGITAMNAYRMRIL